MKLRVLGCFGGSVKGRHLSCFLLNDSIALDAGSLTQALTLEEQTGVRHIIVSHSHLDHNCALAFFADNVYGRIEQPALVYGTPPVVASLRQHMFNDVLWPDFSRLPNNHSPTIRFQEIQEERPFTIDKLTFTPLAVNHITPTVGFLIEDRKSSIIVTSDTGPTDRVWEVANAKKNLKAVIVEASFPNEEKARAEVSGHMTPELLKEDLLKFKRRIRILITHVKPSHRSRVGRQLRSLGSRRIELIQQGKTYRF
jgi:cAMP phosphodiesterase